ncbi:MAG: TadE/TadG family type IV pilus assembly protein [Actinomycetota bacterium]
MGGRSVLTERGSSTVEFVLVLPLVVLVLVACLEVAVLARARVEVVAAAREGARVAATHPDPADAVAAVRHALGDPMGSQARISVSRPHVVGRAATVEVAVRRSLAAPLLEGLSVTLRGRAAMRVER